jgi:hypothetical protein
LEKIMPRTFLVILIFIAFLTTNCYAIDAAGAKAIAEKAAGCNKEIPCETKAHLDKNQWIVSVSYIYGYQKDGSPIFKPGGWTGFTISQDGKIEHRFEGE